MPDRPNEITLRFMAEPTDLNTLGNIHGGHVMKWIDQAGFACAVGWCGITAVTIYVGGIRFIKPIHLGDIIEVHARLIHTGTTSMHIAVDVRATDPRKMEYLQTTHCVIIFVALDESGQPTAVPKWVPRNEEELAMQQYAVKLMDLRRGVEEEMRPYLYR